ncbi:MAG: Na+/H+ antiporter NhaA, partial [Flavobacteriales bacterium]|nr:Na+/H+ antiporter NhaA [Flavobacteriales bacterium]
MSHSDNHDESFLHSPAFGGIILFVSAVIAFVWANVSPDNYHHFWHSTIWRTAWGGVG